MSSTKVIHQPNVTTTRADAVKPGDIIMEGVIYAVDAYPHDNVVMLSVVFGTVAVPPHSTVQVLGRIGEDILPDVIRAMREQAKDPEVVTAD